MEIVKNNEFKGIELYFGEKPEKKIIEVLKGAKFRWHSMKKLRSKLNIYKKE